jgi:hypothetical protein
MVLNHNFLKVCDGCHHNKQLASANMVAKLKNVGFVRDVGRAQTKCSAC